MYFEQPAIIEFIEIILTGITLGMQATAWHNDAQWNNVVKEQSKKGLSNHTICAQILKHVSLSAYHEIIEPIANPKDEKDRKKFWEGDKIRHAHGTDLDLANHFDLSIKRGGSAEETAFALLLLTFILLVIHLSFVCYSDNYEYKTKWQATVQGLVFFSSGFAGVLLAISMFDNDQKYQSLADMFIECRPMLLCRRPEAGEAEKRKLEKLEELGIHNATGTFGKILKYLNEQRVCQRFDLKNSAAIMCIVIMALSLIITCNAMDLAIMYDEEDIDEEERARRQVFLLQALHAKRKLHRDRQFHGTDDLPVVHNLNLLTPTNPNAPSLQKSLRNRKAAAAASKTTRA